ncbi:hypothetical protein HYALB_00001127 [Hymenoscyphus albidus]|uniref:Integral membrane protein n=1 Tax=Hymenoscyphus albidus TaxID=595503 RepID=A0A9N9LET2_9HELO|nr:hypothetical protein HYALB_00001127 [Hymenoscyphus albidus]
MVLPSFKALGARRRERKEVRSTSDGILEPEHHSDRTLTPTYTPGVDLKKATHVRKTWILLSCLFFFISVIFIILTEIGNLNNRAGLRDTYFFKLNLSNIIPVSTPDDITLVNSLARSLGLHDFYQVGLWNFCEGYNGEGITYCSPHQRMYWFNPVEILLNELLSGATITLPADINRILSLIRIASHAMFGFFLTGCVMNFISIFTAPTTLYSRWWSLPFAIWTFIAALLTAAGAVIATAMFIIFRNVITSQEGLNIGAEVGTQMFAFMWVGAAFSIFGFVIHSGLSCCCASRRDVKTGRRMGSKKAYGDVATDEKRRPVGMSQRLNPTSLFRRKKNSGQAV